MSDEPEVSAVAASSTEASQLPDAVAPADRRSPLEKNPEQPSLAATDLPKSRIEVAIRPNPEAWLGADVKPREVAETQIRELLGAVQGLEARLAALPIDEAADELKTVQSELAAVAGRLPALQQRLAQEDANRRRTLLVATEFDAEYNALRKQLVEVNQTFEELKTAERPVEEFELRINPVGRRSRGEEIMFRIENDRLILLHNTKHNQSN